MAALLMAAATIGAANEKDLLSGTALAHKWAAELFGTADDARLVNLLSGYGPKGWATATLAPTPSPSPTDLRGIYVYSSDVSQISTGYANTLTSSLNVSGADGLVLVIGWSAIEPTLGQYDWTTLDQWLSRAIASGKKIDLTIKAGMDTPSWLFQPAPNGANAKALNFTISPHSGQTGQCDSETIAPPWDTGFLNRWDLLLAALSAHLKTSDAYNAVTLVRLTGINRTTDELRLPAETPQSTGLACVSDSIAIWQQAGYRPSLLLQGWDQITNSFRKYFPDKSFSVAIIPNNAFPRIAEDGSVISGPVPDQNQPLLSLASQKFPAHFVVQFNFLMPGESPSSAVIQAAQNLGTLAAFQTNNYFGSSGQGAACSEPVTNPTACTDTTFLAMLETGIYPAGRLRSQYIEVFPANVNSFPDAVLQAHLEIMNSSANPLDNLDALFFVRQHYLDFLNREPDNDGLVFWASTITSCGSNQQCVDLQRISASAAFFLSIEFQQTGYLVERMYKVAYGDANGASTLGGSHHLSVPIVNYNQFLPDTAEVGQGVVVGQAGWETVLENNKQAYALDFAQRQRFTNAFATTLTPTQFVNQLFTNAGITPTTADRNTAIAEFGSATNTANVSARARALRDVAENSTLVTNEFNRAFVLMQFFGYLRRDPNSGPDTDYSGYDFWLTKLNQFNGNYINAQMVQAFLTSTEYRQRFGS